MFKVHQLEEPLLRFGQHQELEAPKDGLFLFGPVERANGLASARIGVIGTSAGIGLARAWLQRLSGWIPGKVDRWGEPLLWTPAWPGFEACFGVALPALPLAQVEVDGAAVDATIKRTNRADAVRTTVKMFADAIRTHLRTEEQHPDLWLVVTPDVVYRYGRPQVGPPPKGERVASGIISASAAKKFFEFGDLFPETMEDAETYLFSSNFHHQLKAELLMDQIVLQLVLESTIADRSVVNLHNRPRSLQDEATVAWNFGATLYFKMGSKPWALGAARPRVCYVGLVFKNDETPARAGEACCAAQMFLDSGDGLVFRGALGPWYSEKNGEYHLSKSAAQKLMESVITGYQAKHGHPPAQLFIHGRHQFNEAEWAGFTASVPNSTSLVGVRIQRGDDMRLFRPAASTPVLRGTAVEIGPRHAYLWTRGYVPRLAVYQGFETPKPISVQITHGHANLLQVLADVLALTKVNYNACDFASALPVTLKFADRVGEILMASPRTAAAPPLPFRYYI
jgi:hypothetical protein